MITAIDASAALQYLAPDVEYSLVGHVWSNEEEWAAALDWPAATAKPTFAEVEAAAAALTAERGLVKSCTALQFRRALRAAGLKAQADAFVATQDEEIQEAWEYATIIHADDPFIIDAAGALDINDGDRFALFALAATL